MTRLQVRLVLATISLTSHTLIAAELVLATKALAQTLPPPPKQKPEQASKATGDEDLEIDSWDPQEVADAKSRCLNLLSGIVAEFDVLAPIRKGRCGDAAPILLRSIGRNPIVQISPPARLNCPMAAALFRWIDGPLQQAARKYLNDPIKQMKNISSYACRNRYNAARGKLSQHALANALDLAAFTTMTGRSISLRNDWGETQDDLLKKSVQNSKLTIGDAPTSADKAKSANKPRATITTNQALELAQLKLTAAKLEVWAAQFTIEAENERVRAIEAELSLSDIKKRSTEVPTLASETQPNHNTTWPRTSFTSPLPLPEPNLGRSALDRTVRQAERNLALAKSLQRQNASAERLRKTVEEKNDRDIRRAKRALNRQISLAKDSERRATMARDRARQATSLFDRRNSELGMTGRRWIDQDTNKDLSAANKHLVQVSSASPVSSLPENPSVLPTSKFLRAAHKSACGIFGTVLGPEANDAHRDHFHLDLAPRRRSSYCE